MVVYEGIFVLIVVWLFIGYGFDVFELVYELVYGLDV